MTFLRYDLERNTTPVAEVHAFIQERIETADGLVSELWRQHETRVLAVRWVPKRELLRIKVERAHETE